MDTGAIPPRRKYDYLSLAQNAAVLKMLSKNSAKGEKLETILFSDFLVKINPRDKPQERVLMITDKALYNLLPTNYGKCKRRIALDEVNRVTVSLSSDEFVLHVPSEYDYRMMSLRKGDIIRCLQEAFHEYTGENLPVEYSQQVVLKSVCTSRKQARKIKREGRAHTGSTSSAGSFFRGSTGSYSEANIKRQAVGWGKESCDVSPDDFELLKVIGRGSFGKVMLVRRKAETDKNKVYAMKILRKDAIIQRNQVEHTKAEREILEEIKHPFLMGLHFAFQTDTKLYLVMDYLTGGELFFHLKNEQRFSESRSRFYCAEIALGLGHLHSKNIIYRDLKPENILLDGEGHVKLTDFGLSKRYNDGQQAQTFCGTPEYLAPEVVIGVGHGKEVDWWSLGILLFEMLCGLPPFYHENINLMYEFIQKSPLRIPNYVSPPARDLIAKLLIRDPELRLGAGPRDIEDIKIHSFFKPIDWQQLYDRKIKPEFVPKVRSNADTSNFDDEFTSEPVVDSLANPSALAGQDANFHGFTYQESSSVLKQ